MKIKNFNRGIDLVDIKIINELLASPDIQSAELAKKIGKPLSTIQRRKSDLEKSTVLKRNYEISVQALDGELQRFLCGSKKDKQTLWHKSFWRNLKGSLALQL